MYNEERYITRCLDSLQSQTHKDFEIILIDDGSTDATIEKTSAYPVKILKQEHGGPGKARNWWAQEANGDILIFVDADMYFDERFVERLISPILSGKEIGTAHGVELVGNPSNIWARAWCINRIPNPTARSSVYRAILKNLFLDAGGFDSSKGYFDDNLAHLNNGKWALTIMDAICYHNNPETLSEVYKHSKWVGKSLVQAGALKEYLVAYKYWLLAFVIGGFSIMGFAISHERFVLAFWGIVLIGVLLLEILATKRMIKEKTMHLPYLFSVPLLSIVRGSWYLVGMVQYLISKK